MRRLRLLLAVALLLLAPTLVTGLAYLLARGHGAPGGAGRPPARAQLRDDGHLLEADQGADGDPCDRWHRLTPASQPGAWRTSDSTATWELWLYRHPALPDSGPVWARRMP